MFCFIRSHRFFALLYAFAVLAFAGCKDRSANPPPNLMLSGYIKEVRKVRNIRKPIYDLDTIAVAGVSITSEKIENEELFISITQDEGRLFFAIGQSQPENSRLSFVIGQLSNFTENTIIENSYPAYSAEILSLPWLTGGSTDARSLLLTEGKGLSLFSYRNGGHNVTGYIISLISEKTKD